MDAMFDKLKSGKQNTVDNLVSWMKESKIVEGPDSEEKARKLFSGVSDAADVPLSKFKEALSTIAAEQKKPVEDYFKSLTDKGISFMKNTISAACGAVLGAIGIPVVSGSGKRATENEEHSETEEHSPAHSEVHSPAHSEPHSPAHSEVHSPAHSEVHSPAHSEEHISEHSEHSHHSK